MFSFLQIIAGGIFSVLKVLKHPFISKMVFFPFAIILLQRAITYMTDYVSGYIHSNAITGIAACFGVFDALSLYVSIVVAGWGVKKIVTIMVNNL